MPTFRYLAYDKSGRALRGSDSADSQRQLRRDLGERGLFVSEVVEVGSGKTRRPWLRPRIRLADLSLLMRQLAILVNAGMTLEEALRLVAEQSDNLHQRQALDSWRDGLTAGHSFSASLRRSPYNIDERVIAAIGVAEETGHLHRVLTRVADELEEGNNNRQTLMKGLIYPAVMVVVAILVIGVMVGYVVPQVAKVFVNARQELPWLTRATIALSDGLRSYGPYVFAALAAALVALLVALRDPARRLAWHRLLLGLPVIGPWLLTAALADWCRSLGTLLASGVPVLSALAIAGTSIGNQHLRASMAAVTEGVRRGNGLAASLKTEGMAPGFLLHMVASGEASSELDQMLMRVSDYYSARLKSAVDTLLKLLEPALVVFMGAVVLLIVGAVLVPIVKMNQLI